VAHQTVAARHRHKIALKADQTTCGHTILETRASTTIADHVEQLSFAFTELFHHATLRIVLKINAQVFIGLKFDAILFLKHDTRARYSQLVALATHCFDQDRQM